MCSTGASAALAFFMNPKVKKEPKPKPKPKPQPKTNPSRL